MRFIKLSISICFFTFSGIYYFIKRIITGKKRNTFVILYYHEIPSGQRKRFERQMEELIKVSKPVMADFKGPFENGVNYSAITFDDAFQSVYYNALDTLYKNRIPAIIFVPTGSIGKHPKWIRNITSEISKEKVMTVSQLKELKNNSIKIGSHTHSHPHLTDINHRQIKNELLKSKQELENILNYKIELLAFPHGEYNQNVTEIAREIGYKQTFSIIPSSLISNINNFVVGRVATSPNDWLIEFKLKLTGNYSWLPLASALKKTIRKLLHMNISGKNSNKSVQKK